MRGALHRLTSPRLASFEVGSTASHVRPPSSFPAGQAPRGRYFANNVNCRARMSLSAWRLPRDEREYFNDGPGWRACPLVGWVACVLFSSYGANFSRVVLAHKKITSVCGKRTPQGKLNMSNHVSHTSVLPRSAVHYI